MWIRIYSLLWSIALPLVLARLFLRSVREPGYRKELRGRFGRGDGAGTDGAVWVHAVSAGEVHAVAPLLARLAEREPAQPLLVTCSTASGRARAVALLDDRVEVAWLPFDLPCFVDAFLARRRPSLLVLVETELWPVLIDRCARGGIPVVLANGRLSARSARRYARVPALVRPMLRRFTRILCQDAETAERFVTLGACEESVVVSGSLKFEPRPASDTYERAAVLRSCIAGEGSSAFVIVAGSTHEGEESALLQAFAPYLAVNENWRLVLAPRHPQRFAAVWRLCVDSTLAASRRSEGAPGDGVQVVLWDHLGDLFTLYGAADAAFVGGSLVPVGGHNTVEAAWHGTPAFVGEATWNFQDVNARLRDAGGLTVVEDANGLVAEIALLAKDGAERQRRGAAAKAAVAASAGALTTTVREVEAILSSGGS